MYTWLQKYQGYQKRNQDYNDNLNIHFHLRKLSSSHQGYLFLQLELADKETETTFLAIRSTTTLATGVMAPPSGS